MNKSLIPGQLINFEKGTEILMGFDDLLKNINELSLLKDKGLLTIYGDGGQERNPDKILFDFSQISEEPLDNDVMALYLIKSTGHFFANIIGCQIDQDKLDKEVLAAIAYTRRWYNQEPLEVMTACLRLGLLRSEHVNVGSIIRIHRVALQESLQRIMRDQIAGRLSVDRVSEQILDYVHARVFVCDSYEEFRSKFIFARPPLYYYTDSWNNKLLVGAYQEKNLDLIFYLLQMFLVGDYFRSDKHRHRDAWISDCYSFIRMLLS